jgi:acyl-coenzyme A synthetase/AMP-(fatty) acid ligase
MKNWFDHILLQTRAQPETPAMVMEDRVVTYGMLNTAIERCARRILALDIATDGLVAVQIKNPIRDLTLSLALFRIGMRSISLAQGQVGVESLAYAAVLGDPGTARFFDPVARVTEVTDAWFGEDVSVGRNLPSSFSAGEEVCRVSLTSGSTETPKVINHRLADIGRRVPNYMNFNWRLALCMPGLSSSLGYASACVALAAGKTLCFAESPFQAIRMIDLFSIDFVRCSTEQLLALTRVARKSGAHLRSLRTVWFGGGAPSRALLEAAMIHLCKDIHCSYGASETGTITRTTARELLLNPGLVGDVLPGVEVGIFDSNDELRRIGRLGSVKVRIHDDEPPPQCVDTPWINLDDVGWLASEGRLYILGRAADITLTDLEDPSVRQVSPVHEIEHLLRLEWDVTDAAAIEVEATSDGKLQIWVGVVDNCGANAEKLCAIARPRGIAHATRIFDLQAIPRGANGKVNRAQLRALMVAATVKPPT